MRTLIESFAAIEQAFSRVIDEVGRPDPIVRIYFSDRKTVAELVKGGKVVKTAEARCNPKDTYSRGEGAKIALERLFEKKRKEGKPKVGDKFVVVGDLNGHEFPTGEIVTLCTFSEGCSLYADRYCRKRRICDFDVKPYKEPAK